MQKINNKNCGSGDAIVGYIYNELPSPERLAFEDHLLDCTACTDEFAVIADSRYSVYEWQKLEFVPLPTPRFVIPYAETKVSWFDAIKSVFATGPRLATAGAFGLLIALSVAAIFLPSNSGDVAFVPPVKVAEPVTENNQTGIETPSVEFPVNTLAEANAETRTEENVEDTKPIPVVEKRSSKPKKVRKSPVRPGTFAARESREPVSSPRLNDFEDLSDDSLRLSDLLADIDTRD